MNSEFNTTNINNHIITIYNVYISPLYKRYIVAIFPCSLKDYEKKGERD